jgi:hypothetical protein
MLNIGLGQTVNTHTFTQMFLVCLFLSYFTKCWNILCLWISLCHYLSSTGCMQALNEWCGSCVPHHFSVSLTVHNSIKPIFSTYWPRTKSLKSLVLKYMMISISFQCPLLSCCVML